MPRNGLPAMWILTAAFALLVTGCSNRGIAPSAQNEASLALNALQKLYGPPDGRRNLPQDFVSDPVLVDLNEDGRRETIVLFGDEGLGRPRLDAEGRNVICRGFLILTEVNRRQWPVFYYYSEWRADIVLWRTAKRAGIMKSGGKDGQFFWGWYKGNGDWAPRWESRHRTWDQEASEYGPWQIYPPLFANYGK